MNEAMQGIRSLSLLSDKLLRPTDSNLLHLLNLFSFLILILPYSVLSTICLNSLILRSLCPQDIVGSSGSVEVKWIALDQEGDIYW